MNIIKRLGAILSVGILLLISTVSTTSSLIPTNVSAAEDVELLIYVQKDCINCANLDEFLDEFLIDYPTVTVNRLEIADNIDLMRADGEKHNFKPGFSPTTILQDRVWVGYSPQIGENIGLNIHKAVNGEEVESGVWGFGGGGTCTEDSLECSADEYKNNTINVPLIGEVEIDPNSLLVSTAIIGFVDGINPCSLWVITILLSIVLRTGSRKRVVAIGTTFLLITAGMYGLYMFGLYSALSVIPNLNIIQWGVAIIALIFGAVSVKDYFAFKKGLSFTISDSSKPGLYKRMRAAAGHKKLLPAIAATSLLAVLVSLLETPCTAGFPVLWTGLLHTNGVSGVEAIFYFIVYMIPFLIDEFVIFGIALITMRIGKLQDKHAELLKLVGGVIMLTLAGVIIIDPSLMESPTSALIIFLAASVFAAIIHIITVKIKHIKIETETINVDEVANEVISNSENKE